jgi:F420-non-reducing hydrogenase large subunit
LFGNPAHSTILFDYAHLIELLYACEKVKEILHDKNITNTDVRVKIEPKSGKVLILWYEWQHLCSINFSP